MFYKKYRALKVNELLTVNSTRLLLHVNSCQTYRMTPFHMFYKQYRTLKVNELLTVKSVTLSGQLWQAFTYGVPDLFEPESAKPYLSHVEFLPFLHKFNTFTFYTPYLLDQKVNASGLCILLIPHIYLFFYQKVNANVFGGLTRFFFDQLETPMYSEGYPIFFRPTRE